MEQASPATYQRVEADSMLAVDGARIWLSTDGDLAARWSIAIARQA